MKLFKSNIFNIIFFNGEKISSGVKDKIVFSHIFKILENVEHNVKENSCSREIFERNVKNEGVKKKGG